jgi:hypothetical protein
MTETARTVADPLVRACVYCEASLNGRRKDARYCSGSCRAEASVARAILSGRKVSPYKSAGRSLFCP